MSNTMSAVITVATCVTRAGKLALLAICCVGFSQLAIADSHEEEEAPPCSLTQCFGINWEQPSLKDIRDLNPSLRDANGSSPLHYAARNCVPASHIHTLALNGADVNEIEPGSGYTPLQLSLIVCRTPTLQSLLSLGADPNMKVAGDGGNILHLALRRKKPRITIERLVRSQVDLDAVDDEGLTPMVMMLAEGDLEMAKLLLDAGANPNVSDNRQVTPAHYAAQKLDHEFLNKLVRHGANLDVVTDQGLTPAHYAAAAGMNPEMAAIFFEADADMNAFDDSGKTPLHYASAKTPAESVAALLVLRANPHLVDGEGSSALHYALLYNADPRVVTALLRLGADPNLADDEKTVPIELAVGHPAGSTAMLELISYGAHVDLVDGSGRTLLHIAVAQNDAAVAARLLEYGADPYAEDVFGVTPIRMALEGELGEPARSMFTQIYEERLARRREAEQSRQERAEKRRSRQESLTAQREKRKAERKVKLEERRNKRKRQTDDKTATSDRPETGDKSLEDIVEETVGDQDLVKELEQVEQSIRERLSQILKEAEERKN